MKIKNKKFIFVSFLAVLPLFIVGGFLIIPNKSSDEVVEEMVVEVVYPEIANNFVSNLELDVSAAFSIYYDDKRRTVLFEKNPDEKLPIASISKIMTALIVLDNYNLEEPIHVTEKDIISRTEFRDFRAWSETKIGEMLYPMIIESNNSAAFALALISSRFLETNGDSVENFVYAMNLRAKEIGLNDTNFINPSGLDGENKYNQSTAKEIAQFSEYIIKNKMEIFEISKMPAYRLYSLDGTIYYDVSSTNIFLHDGGKEWHKKIIGGKTGWTKKAYGCLLIILAVPETGGYIINVILGAENRFLEMEKMINYVYESYIF